MNDLDGSTDEFVIFMTNFYALYPEFESRDLYLSGESYAGKFVPRYTYQLLEENTSLGYSKFNVSAALIGDPFVSPLTQRTHMHVLAEALNILNESNLA